MIEKQNKTIESMKNENAMLNVQLANAIENIEFLTFKE